jgi:hypothetical protein
MPRFFTLKNITQVAIIKQVYSVDVCRMCQGDLGDACGLCEMDVLKQWCPVGNNIHLHCTETPNDDETSGDENE